VKLPLAVSHRDYRPCLLRALDAVGFEESAAKWTQTERETETESRRRRLQHGYCCSFSQVECALRYNYVSTQ
jgi:CO/xanthine dehydrogenase Mo-binding subunit